MQLELLKNPVSVELKNNVFFDRDGEEYWTLQKYFLEEEVQRELSDITVTNRKQKKEK